MGWRPRRWQAKAAPPQAGGQFSERRALDRSDSHGPARRLADAAPAAHPGPPERAVKAQPPMRAWPLMADASMRQHRAAGRGQLPWPGQRLHHTQPACPAARALLRIDAPCARFTHEWKGDFKRLVFPTLPTPLHEHGGWLRRGAGAHSRLSQSLSTNHSGDAGPSHGTRTARERASVPARTLAALARVQA